MSVTQGFEAFASEYNTLNTKVNKWFADNYPDEVFGDTNQRYGWGGSDSTAITSGIEMLASDMNSLIDRCNIGGNICNNVTGTLNQIVADTDDILASQYNDIETKAGLIDTYKLNIKAAELSLLNGDNSERNINYSAAIDCVFKYTFNDFPEAKYFWNSAGAINISGIISGYTSGEGYDGAGINEILTTMGTITMDYTNTIQSGSGGTPSNIGFYDLPTTYTLIFTQSGTGVYSDAKIEIKAARSTIGEYILVQVVITPESGRTVDGTTTITSQYRILDNQTSGSASLIITDPTPTVENELE